MGEMRNACKILVGKTKRKRTLRGSRRRWEHNIGVNMREIQWQDADWIHMVEHREQWWAVVKTVMNLQVP
jgi:hypothetical protein